MDDYFDPFQVFGIDHMIEIPNLDTKYYELVQNKTVSLELLNLAYNQLKDPIKRLLFLCSIHVDAKDPQVLQNLFLKLSESSITLSINELLSLAKSGDWIRCWIELQFALKQK